MFYGWLQEQATRADDVGRLATFTAGDRAFPRGSHRLHVLLKYCGTNRELRRLMKRAHREWRAARDAAPPQADHDATAGGEHR